MNSALPLKPLFSPRRYRRAPIKEAIVDFRVTLPTEVGIDKLLAIHLEIRDQYPTSKKRMNVEGEFSAGERISASARQSHNGFAFYSADNLYVFQARLDGFTFSRLAPYESWENLRGQARRHWELYRRHATPLAIHRVALRYINEIAIRGPRIDFDEYFLTIPKIGHQLPQDLSHFLMQIQLPQPDLNANALVTQSLAPTVGPGMVSVILDIDVFVEGREISEEDAWSVIEALRIRKNDIFEGSITDKARELFF